MNRFDYPLPPLILGFILGPVIEENLRSALMSSRGAILPFFERPVTAFFLVAILLYVLGTLFLGLRATRRRKMAEIRA